MNKNNNQKEKLPRGIVIANNKKQTDIKNVLILRDEMIANKIDEKLIKKFLDEQYEKINGEYEKRITKHTENTKNQAKKKSIQENKKKREKAVEFLLKNKTFLEEHGASKEYVKKYVEKQYQEINEYYDTSNIHFDDSDSTNTNANDLADFID